MTREEFLSQLREALRESLSADAVQENVNYYNDYISDEVRNGKREEDVLKMLGDPWILAKTITSANGGNGRQTVYDADEVDYTSGGGRRKNGGASYTENGSVHITVLDKWWKKLLLLLVVVMIVMLVVAVISGVARLLAPVAVPIVVVLIVMRLLNRRR